jgi:hypothetical protein
MKYDAFISYRHGDLDGLVAEKLHKLLEAYRVPRAIAKSGGKKRIARVFRDRDELPTSSDLSKSITDALENSAFLVLICSPRTKESQWVLQEIEYFGALHGKDRIIAVLIAGEPEDAFPPGIAQRVIDGRTVQVEPLAADIRAETQAGSVKLLKNEKLRVIAPILGCAYDDLRQRHRARRRKRIATATSAVLSLSLLFGGLFAWQQARIREQTLRKLENESMALAGRAAETLADGDPQTALRFALAGLPKNPETPERPYVAAAEEALAEALGVYDLSDGYKSFRAFELPSPPFKLALSASGLAAAAVYAYEVAVFRTETAEIEARLPAAQSALADIEFIGDDLIVCAGADGLCVYDVTEGKVLWTGAPATNIAVSADGNTIAAVYRDEGFAAIYAADGAEKAVISFDGRKQRLAANDSFANPNDNLLALRADGGLLAASFDDGSLGLFDLAGDKGTAELLPPSAFTHFEGGFSGKYFAFSATGTDGSVFAAVDTAAFAQTGGFASDGGRFGVLADESGIFVSSDNLVVRIDPADGARRELAYTDGDVTDFARDARHTIVATDNRNFALFDAEAKQVARYGGDNNFDFVRVAGDFAIAGGRDTPVLRFLRREDRSEARIFSYDAAYMHDEARVRADGARVMLFSYDGFRLYDAAGRLLRAVEIPDAGLVYDQQYSKESGNLAVIYRDALRIYSGTDGMLLFEETGLQSTFYAPYGISLLGPSGTLRLIDADTAAVLFAGEAEGGFAACCGMVVDAAFLAGRDLLGAARTDGGGFLFAVGDGENGTLYDGDGKERFGFAVAGEAEAFFTADALIVSPEHGTPAVYSLETGEKRAELEKDAYLTYITDTEKGAVSEYVSADGARFGILLNADYAPVARLPALTDLTADALLFDYKEGSLRKSRIYSVDELIDMAE